MISRISKKVICFIDSILHLKCFGNLHKQRNDFIVIVLWHFLSIKGKINFLQLGRFSQLNE